MLSESGKCIETMSHLCIGISNLAGRFVTVQLDIVVYYIPSATTG